MKCSYCKKTQKTVTIPKYDDRFLGARNVVLINSVTKTLCTPKCTLNDSTGFPALGPLHNLIALDKALAPSLLCKQDVRNVFNSIFSYTEKYEWCATLELSENVLIQDLFSILAVDVAKQKLLRIAVVMKFGTSKNLKDLLGMNLSHLDYDSVTYHYRYNKARKIWQKDVKNRIRARNMKGER